MTGAAQLLSDLGVSTMTIRQLRDAEREMFTRAKADLKANAQRTGKRYAECRCGVLIIQPEGKTCPECKRALNVVEPAA